MQRTQIFILTWACIASVRISTAAIVDTLSFGDKASESAHQWSDSASESFSGALGQSARRLLSPDQAWEGGTMKFTVSVDPTAQNYVTVKFSGSDAAKGMLVLFCEGKQIGYRHLGDVDALDYSTDEPTFAGRFTYTTTPLPKVLTDGKNQVSLEIRSYGPIWGYAQNFEKYQQPMKQPSRGIYKLYTHTEGAFSPPPDEKQGHAPQPTGTSQLAGTEVLDVIKQRVNGEIRARLESSKPCSQMQLQLLARAYDVKWTSAFKNPEAVRQILTGLDALFVSYRKNPSLAEAEPSTWNPDWFGLGVCGEVITLRRAELANQFDQSIDDGAGNQISRRAAYTEMLVACRDWHRAHRRLYTNQTMINDLNGIYHANRGIAILTPEKAMPEKDAKRYLYESLGLQPWKDSDILPGSDEKSRAPNWNVGDSYMQLTAKGLTRELGYVGSYGEVIDLVCEIYDATRPSPDQPGDEMIRQQLIKIAKARASFRYPSVDADGHCLMRLEQVIGWRDSHYPGYPAYVQRATRDASALRVAAITLDPQLVGASQQMLADQQFFTSEVEAIEDNAQPLRTTIGRLFTPDDYDSISSQPSRQLRLPMTPGQPDYVFTDEEDGVVAIKHGNEILYASLYWRARYGINSLARIHFTKPEVDHIAVVHQDVQFTPSGSFYTRPNWTNFAFGNGGPQYPVKFDSALAGEKLPIAKIPAGIEFKPGDESVYAGRADFYSLQYGDYLIGMNLTQDRSFELKIPAGRKIAKELVSGKMIQSTLSLRVAPRSTMVLKFDSGK